MAKILRRQQQPQPQHELMNFEWQAHPVLHFIPSHCGFFNTSSCINNIGNHCDFALLQHNIIEHASKHNEKEEEKPAKMLRYLCITFHGGFFIVTIIFIMHHDVFL
jgi:hypothetical protein